MIDVLVVGSGPAGLTAAAELRRQGAGRVVVIDREQQPGGIPRHTAHTGFGLRDLHRMVDGPAYAHRLVDWAVATGVELHLGTTALGWDAERSLSVLAPAVPPAPWPARAVVLATGTRERPRSARLVPGDRPPGVLTTGALQQLVRAGLPVGRRAVIVGAEHVSFSAVLTLAHAGCRTVALVTSFPHHQTYGALRAAVATRWRVPVLSNVTLTRIEGRGRVQAVQLSDGRRLACDTVVFTGDWIPENELARRAGLHLSPGSLGPQVDGALRTARPGVFAAGNLLHGAETADVCALDGHHVAAAVTDWLDGRPWPSPGVPVQAESPVRWVTPSRVAPDRSPPPRRRFVLRVDRFVPGRRLCVVQGDEVLWTGRSRHALVPNRSISLPSTWLVDVDAAGPAVVVGVGDLR